MCENPFPWEDDDEFEDFLDPEMYKDKGPEELSFIEFHNKIILEKISRHPSLSYDFAKEVFNVNPSDLRNARHHLNEPERVCLTGIILCKEYMRENIVRSMYGVKTDLSLEKITFLKRITIVENLAACFEKSLIDLLQRRVSETSGEFYLFQDGSIIFYPLTSKETGGTPMFSVAFEEEYSEKDLRMYPPDVVT